MIGASLSLGVLTQNPACEADKRLLDEYGGIKALLSAFGALGVCTIELRSVQAYTDAGMLADCAHAVLDAGLSMSIHAALDDLPAEVFFQNLSPVLEMLPKEHPILPLVVHSMKTGDEMRDRADTVRLLSAWGRFAEKSHLPVRLALENNRIHESGRSIVDCGGVISTVREVALDNVGVCFDFGHQYSNFVRYPKCTPCLPDDDFLRAAIHTHIHALTHTTHYPLTAGELPLEVYIQNLRRCGYRGVYNLELECGRFWQEVDPRAAFEGSIDALKGCLERIEKAQAGRVIPQMMC